MELPSATLVRWVKGAGSYSVAIGKENDYLYFLSSTSDNDDVLHTAPIAFNMATGDQENAGDLTLGGELILPGGKASVASSHLMLESDSGHVVLKPASAGQAFVHNAGSDRQIVTMGTGSSAPTGDNDSTEGFGVGSFWLDVNNEDIYVCFGESSPGNAVWKQVTLT